MRVRASKFFVFALVALALGAVLGAPGAGVARASAPGTVFAWGYNSDGQGTVPASLVGVPVIAVAGGFLPQRGRSRATAP